MFTGFTRSSSETPFLVQFWIRRLEGSVHRMTFCFLHLFSSQWGRSTGPFGDDEYELCLRDWSTPRRPTVSAGTGAIIAVYNLYFCIYVYMYGYIYICIYIYMSVCVYIYIYTYMYTYIYLYLYLYMRTVPPYGLRRRRYFYFMYVHNYISEYMYIYSI